MRHEEETENQRLTREVECRGISSKPRLAFDTSALNRLAKCDEADVYIAAIRSVYEVRLPELVTGEIYATRNPAMRKSLNDVCCKLLSSGYCMSPPHWLIYALVKAHHQNPTTFDWSIVPWRAHYDEDQIRTGIILGNEDLSCRQLEAQTSAKKDFKKGFKRESVRPVCLETFDKWIEQQKRNGGFLTVSRNLYVRALRYDPGMHNVPVAPQVEISDDELRKFVDECPPFRALACAYAMTAFDVCLQKSGDTPRYSAGRNDQFMSVYLPYCDQFITAEKNRVQELCLCEIARDANLATEVLSYDDFCTRLMVTS